jgi:CBS domain-containing protein
MKIPGTISAILQQKGSQAYAIAPEATVFEAIQVMADRNVGSLLVLSGDELLGVVTERDYTRKVALKGRSSRETRVREVVSSPVISVGLDTSVEEGMRLMTVHRVRHLPVLEAGKVAGVVSIGDLVNWTISAQNTTITQLTGYIAGQYPG